MYLLVDFFFHLSVNQSVCGAETQNSF